MKKLRKFKCSKSGEVFERMTIDEITIVMCKCKSQANRTLSAPRCFGNTTGKSPATRY